MTFRERCQDMPSLLAAVREMPGLFLGRKTITGMYHMLNGISYAEDFHAIPTESRLGGFDINEFDRWVASRYDLNLFAERSFTVAARLAGSESAGFDLWFSWYDEFQADSVRRAVVR